MNNDDDVKYIPPFGAAPVKSTLCVANVTTPLCDTVNMLLPAKFLIKNNVLALPDTVVTPLTVNDPEIAVEPVIIGANNLI